MLSRKHVGNSDDYFNKNFSDYVAGFQSKGNLDMIKTALYCNFIIMYNTVLRIFPLQGNRGSVSKNFTSLPLPALTAFASLSKISTIRPMWLSLTSSRFQTHFEEKKIMMFECRWGQETAMF